MSNMRVKFPKPSEVEHSMTGGSCQGKELYYKEFKQAEAEVVPSLSLIKLI